MKTIDIICIGEVLIDFIGHEVDASINKTKDYHRFLGGSPTNVAVNASRLGLHAVLVASCGNDGFGDYVIRKLKSNQVNFQHVRKSETTPTSVIFVSKSTETSVSLILKNNEATFEQYPFEYQLEIAFILSDFSLDIHYEVLNHSNVEMPFSIGAHPAFAIHKSLDSYKLIFDQPFTADRFLIDQGLYDGQSENVLENDNDINVVIITGSGERAFVAGADVGDLAVLDGKGAIEFNS